MSRIALMILHLAFGLSSLGAGQALVRKPSGENLTFETEWLRRSPFRDYRVPGLFMVFVIAPLNLLSLRAQGRRGAEAPYLSIVSGLVLVVWLGIQTAIIGYRHWSQLVWMVLFPLTGVLGLVQLRQRPRG